MHHLVHDEEISGDQSSRLSELEAGVSRPPAPREPEHSPARNCLSQRLAVRAGEHSGPARPSALWAAGLLTLVLTTALDSCGRTWTARSFGSRSADGCGRPWIFLILLRIR